MVLFRRVALRRLALMVIHYLVRTQNESPIWLPLWPLPSYTRRSPTSTLTGTNYQSIEPSITAQLQLNSLIYLFMQVTFKHFDLLTRCSRTPKDT